MSTTRVAEHQRRQTGRLFAALALGERLAHQCALRQSELVDCERSRRFLRAQARQEFMHARLFEQAGEWLTPGCGDKAPASLLAFGQRLERALARGDLTESLLASQIVLEGVGEQILLRLNHAMDRRGVGFKRMRRLILRQEQSHHAFGLRSLHRNVEQGLVSLASIHELADTYLRLVRGIFNEMADVFAALDEDIGEYLPAVADSLPAWILPEGQDSGRPIQAR